MPEILLLNGTVYQGRITPFDIWFLSGTVDGAQVLSVRAIRLKISLHLPKKTDYVPY